MRPRWYGRSRKRSRCRRAGSRRSPSCRRGGSPAPPGPASRARRRASTPCSHSSAAGGGMPRPTGRGSWRPGSPSRPGPGARAGQAGPRRPCGSRAPARRRPGSHGRSSGRALRSPSEPRSGRSAGYAARRVRCRRRRGCRAGGPSACISFTTSNACGRLPIVAACRGIGGLLSVAVVLHHREDTTPT